MRRGRYSYVDLLEESSSHPIKQDCFLAIKSSRTESKACYIYLIEE